MTNELVRMVQERAHISEDAARNAVDTVIQILKHQLPAPISDQVERVLTNFHQDSGGKPIDASFGFGGKLLDDTEA